MKYLSLLLIVTTLSASESKPIPDAQPASPRFVIFSVNEPGNDGILSTNSGQLVTTPVIYRFDTVTGKTWRMQKITIERKDGEQRSIEGWREIPDKDPLVEGAKWALPEKK